MTEGPYELPPAWRWVRLGEVSQLINGKTARKNEYLNENTGIKILKFRDLTTEGEIVWDNDEAGFVPANRRWSFAQVGDVLITAAAHTPEQIGRKVGYLGRIPQNLVQVSFSAELLSIRADTTTMDGRWVYFWLRSAKGFHGIQKQVKEKHLVKSRASEIFVPLPPLSEQRRIVARIEELMERIREARRLREDAKGDADRLMQAALAEVFPRPGSDLPVGWRLARLGEACEVWDRHRRPVKKSERKTGNVPYCGANGVLDYVEGHTHEGEFVLLAEDGGFYGPGDSSAYFMTGRFWANNHVHILRGQHGVIENGYLLYWLNAADLKPFLTGATRPKLTQSAMATIPIPIAPLNEQGRTVAHLDAVQEQAKALRQAQDETDADLRRLEQSIFDRAFRGTL